MDWQPKPFETAPKGPGKRVVLLFCPVMGIYIGSYISDKNGPDEEAHPWFTNGRRTREHQLIHPPTHWMPLPAPPVPVGRAGA